MKKTLCIIAFFALIANSYGQSGGFTRKAYTAAVNVAPSWTPAGYSANDGIYAINTSTGEHWRYLLGAWIEEITITWSGTTNYVSKWTPDGNTLGNSQIFDNGTNVGIGTIAVNSKLHIAQATGNYILNLHGTGTGETQYLWKIATSGNLIVTTASNRSVLWTPTGSVAFGNLNSDAITGALLYVDNSSNNVGISTTSPTEKLHVTGNVRFSGALMPNNLPGTSGQVLTSAGAGVPPTWTTPSSGGNGMFSASNNAGTWAVTSYSIAAATTGSLLDNTASIYRLSEGTNKYIDINTTDAAEMLTLGNFNATVKSEGRTFWNNGAWRQLATSYSLAVNTTASVYDAVTDISTSNNSSFLLPLSPDQGRTIRVSNRNTLASLTIDGNGRNINGSPTYTLPKGYGWADFIAINGVEWRAYPGGLINGAGIFVSSGTSTGNQDWTLTGTSQVWSAGTTNMVELDGTNGRVAIGKKLSTFQQTSNYSAGIDSTRLFVSLGSNAAPVANASATAVFQKVSSTTANGHNASVYASIKKTTTGVNHRATAIFAEAEDAGDAQAGLNGFVEGVRAHGIVNGQKGSGYGVIGFAGANAGFYPRYLIGVEADVHPVIKDAPGQLNRDSFYVPFVATNSGTKIADAGFLTNPYNASKFRIGYLVGYESVTDVAFRTEANTIIGLDLTGGTQSFASIVTNNSAPIRSLNAANNALLNWQFVDNNNNLVLGYETSNLILSHPAGAAGNVGIGKTAPTQKLDVDGNIQFSQALMPNSLAGAIGQVLVSQGPNTAPIWVNATQNDTIVVVESVVHTNNSVAVAAGTSEVGFVIPSNMDNYDIIRVSYRTNTAVAGADLNIQLKRQTAAGTASNIFSSSIAVGSRFSENAGSFDLEPGDYILCDVPVLVGTTVNGLSMTVTMKKR